MIVRSFDQTPREKVEGKEFDCNNLIIAVVKMYHFMSAVGQKE